MGVNMLLLWMCGVAEATDLPAPGQGELVLGVGVSPNRVYDTRSLAGWGMIGGARIGLVDRVSVAFPAVFRVETLQTGDGELTLVGGLSVLGWGSSVGFVTGWTVGVEGRWDFDRAQAAAWADLGLNTLGGLDLALFDTQTSWSGGVLVSTTLGARWTVALPLAVAGRIGDSRQSLSVGLVDPSIWDWRTPQTLGGVPVPTLAYRLGPHWAIHGYSGATWWQGAVSLHQYLGVGYRW